MKTMKTIYALAAGSVIAIVAAAVLFTQPANAGENNVEFGLATTLAASVACDDFPATENQALALSVIVAMDLGISVEQLAARIEPTMLELLQIVENDRDGFCEQSRVFFIASGLGDYL